MFEKRLVDFRQNDKQLSFHDEHAVKSEFDKSEVYFLKCQHRKSILMVFKSNDRTLYLCSL